MLLVYSVLNFQKKKTVKVVNSSHVNELVGSLCKIQIKKWTNLINQQLFDTYYCHQIIAFCPPSPLLPCSVILEETLSI